MAITIQSEPDDLQPASNPIEFEFSSTNTSEPAFSFIVELTVNGSVHSFHQVFPESSNFGRFDASAILRTIVFSSLNTSTALSVSLSSSIASYSIRVAEKYGDPTPVIVGSYVASSTYKCINGALRQNEWINFDILDYDFSTTSPCNFLTFFPSDQKYYCGLTESAFVSVLSSAPFTSDFAVRLYDVTGASIATDLVSPLVSADMLRIDVSPSSIITNTTITTANFSTCYYYTVEAYLSGANTDPFKIYIDTECSQYTSRRLHWLNKLGGFDSYSFIKYSEESSRISSNSYQRDPGAWSSTNTFDYNIENGSSFSGTKTSTDTMKLNSDWIKQEKHNWLMPSLLESPLVYLEVSQGVFEPVIVSTNSYTKKQKIKEGLIQEEIKIQRTYNYTSQLG